MKRSLALILTAVLCLQLCVPAFATETASDATADTAVSDEALTSETAEDTADEEDVSVTAEAEAEAEETEDTETATETETVAETETATVSDDLEVDALESAEDGASDSTEDDDTLYNGNEADYNDPQFLQLLEDGFFEESENDGISTVSSSYSHNSRFNGYTITQGIDISKWNGMISWSKVKASGISFVMIRCGYRGASDGTLYTDDMFATNIKGALAAGLEVGVYVYSQAITTSEAKAEANFALKLCAGYDFTLPIVLDFEYYTTTSGRLAEANLSKTQQTNICLAFCDTVDAAGYGAMVYASRSMLEDDTYGQQIADAGYEVWLAQWNSSTTYSGTYTYWQYSDSGSVSGIDYAVDMNYRYELPSPTITLTYCAAAGVRLAWSSVSLADSYAVYRRASGETAWTKLGTVSSSDTLTWLDETAVAGTTYEYVVRACDDAVLSPYQRTGTTVDYEPEFSLSSAAQTSSGVKLTWTASSDYDQYKILRRTGYSGSWSTIATISDVSQTSYLDTSTLTGGIIYSYTIVGVSDGQEDSYDPYGLQMIWLDAPELVSAASYKTGMKVTWSSVTGAEGYRVYRKAETSWKLIATVSGNSTVTYYDSASSTAGTTYTYTVRAYRGSVLSPYNSTGISGIRISTPTLVSAAMSGSNMKIQWKAVSGATTYYIYRKTSSSSWSRIGTASGSATTYYDSTASSGTVYTYTVRVTVSGNMSWFDESGVSGLYLGTVTLKSATRTSSGVTVTWSTISGATKYAVYRRSASSSWKKIATVTKTSYSDTSKLSSDVKYYYTVRAVATYNGSTVMGYYNTTGLLLTTLSTPSLTSVTRNSSGGLTVKWKSVSNAVQYIVYRKTGSSSWKQIATTTGTSWTDTTAQSGTVYTYTVRASDGEGKSGYDTAGISGIWLATPTLVSASTTATDVKVQWKAVSGATGYRVYRRTANGSWTRLANVTGTSYTDTGLTSYDTNYYYTVRAYTTLNGTTWLSGYDSSGVMIHYLASPKLSSVSSVTTGLKVSWSSVSGATQYVVYRKTGSSSWKQVSTTSGTSWTDTSAQSGTVYTYTVRASDGTYRSGYNTTGISGLWLATPTLTSASITSTGVKVQWSAVSGATGYRVYRRTDSGSWKRLANVTGTSYTDTSLTEYDTNYYYTVRAYTTLNGSTYLSNYDQSGVIIHYLAVPQLTEISSTASGITVSWLKVSGATSYRLYRKTSSSKWVNIATLDSSCTSYTDTTGVSGTTYFYTVRAQSSDGMSWFDSVGISATCQ